MDKLICDNCGAVSDTPEERELLYWIEKADCEIVECLCSQCKPFVNDNTVPSFEGALKLLKIRANYPKEL